MRMSIKIDIGMMFIDTLFLFRPNLHLHVTNMRLSKTVNLWNLGNLMYHYFLFTHIKLFKSLMLVVCESPKSINFTLSL